MSDDPQVRDYGQYCPVSIGSEVLADRWTPLILRELILGSTRFNDIERGLPGISRTLLLQRLKHLARTGVLERRPLPGRGHEYVLTPAGQDLEPVIMALGEWAVRWMYTEPEAEQVEPISLTWWMHRRVALDQLPDQRVVIEFDYQNADPKVIWLVLDRGEPSVCQRHPGYDTDIVCTSEPLALMRVFSGIVPLDAARRDGSVELNGPRDLVSKFGDWFLWSPFAPAVRQVVAGL